MRYGGGQHKKFMNRKQQVRLALELAVEDPGQIMERGQAEASPDPQHEGGDSEGSS